MNVVLLRSIMVAVAVLWAVPDEVFADITLVTSGNAQYQYNSNVFDTSPAAFTAGAAAAQRYDSDFAYGGNIQLIDQWQQQKFFFNLNGTEYRYDHYTYLDHPEYNLDTGLDWKVGGQLDGKLDVLRTHTMVQFFNLVPGSAQQANLAIETEQRETAQIGFLTASDFRVEGIAFHSLIDEPLVGNPNLKLSESSGSAALKYVGRAGLTAGVTVGYMTGDFSGESTTIEPSYHQINYDLTTSYQPTGRSMFTGEIGYSERKSATGSNDVSGATGLLEYKAQLTGKTSMDVIIGRAINSYIANQGSEIDTSATLDALWQITYKIGLAVSYSYTDSDLLNQGAIAGTNRIDHLQRENITLTYDIFRWLSIKPYATFQDRQSDVALAHFSANTYGITITAKSFK